MLKKIILLTGLITILVNHNTQASDQKALEDPASINPFVIDGRLSYIQKALKNTPADRERLYRDQSTDESLKKEYWDLLDLKTKMLKSWLERKNKPDVQADIQDILNKHLDRIQNESAHK